MAAVMKRCRVCGKEYEPCRSARLTDGVFHWREVACSPECGAVYLAQVNAARGAKDADQAQPETAPKKTRKSKAKGESHEA